MPTEIEIGKEIIKNNFSADLVENYLSDLTEMTFLQDLLEYIELMLNQVVIEEIILPDIKLHWIFQDKCQNKRKKKRIEKSNHSNQYSNLSFKGNSMRTICSLVLKECKWKVMTQAQFLKNTSFFPNLLI